QHRTLETSETLGITLPDGSNQGYIDLTEGDQSGVHHQRLATDAATYLLQRLTHNTTLSIDTASSPNPGQSFLGHSQTRQAELQAQSGTDLIDPSVQVNYRWEGWNISRKDTLKLTDFLSAHYGFELYPQGFLNDTQNIKLYEILLSVILYSKALDHIVATTPQQEWDLELK